MRYPLLIASLLAACSEYDLTRGGDEEGPGAVDSADPVDGGDGGEPEPEPEECDLSAPDPRLVGGSDECEYEIGGFTPIAARTYGSGEHSMASPVVADLDLDGMPEVIANVTSLLGFIGRLVVYRGDSSQQVWDVADSDLGYGSSMAVGDLDGDGYPEIVTVKEYEHSLFADGDYTVKVYDRNGQAVWESEHFVGLDFDYATAPSISDMDHDGSPEVVAGRVILNADGTTRGVGAYGRGSYGVVEVGGWTITESSISAVADLDLNGIEEVIVGNAFYTPDGGFINADPAAEDGMVAIANLDDDPEGEVVLSTYNSIRALDTDMSTLWGPLTIQSANILSPPAIDDIDGDGYPEIIVAGGNWLYALNHDGGELWRSRVTDMSGASGASIFDFEADGIPEVVYIDEVQLVAYDGLTGAVRFQSDAHASATMMEYPVIADVDADGHADIIVPHNGHSSALTVYKDINNSWAPTRKVWNQHPYSITNINDDLSIPQEAVPNFTVHNSWHSAFDEETSALLEADLTGEIVDVCALCDEGVVVVWGWLVNRTLDPLAPGVPVSLYARGAGGDTWLVAVETTETVEAGWTGEILEFELDLADVEGAEALWMVVDDAGDGVGIIEECAEENNGVLWAGPFCE